MNINNFIIYILLLFMVAGALDKCLGNRFGLGEKFDDGFKAMGPLALAMVGIISLAPVLVNVLNSVISPIYSALGSDPAMFAPSFLAIDMGGYPLAMQMAHIPWLGSFAGILLGSMLGATIIFTIPVALGIISREDRRYLAIGTLIGLPAIPAGCLIGGLVAGFPLKMMLINLVPVIIISTVIFLGLWLASEMMIKLFYWFSHLAMIVITLATAVGVIEALTGIIMIPGMAPIWDGIKIVGSIAIILLGAFPLIAVTAKILKKPLVKVGQLFRINEAAVTGLIATLANNIIMFSLMKNMDNRGKILNVAFGVGAAFMLGDHLGFVASVDRTMIFPMIVGKLSAGLLAFTIAYLFVSKINILEKINS